ncbi:MAG: esterase family protein [Gammaproteobacteria bacterium]|nr:MAG: esterase family protein [Gammaproteobacteria bacterium]
MKIRLAFLLLIYASISVEAAEVDTLIVESKSMHKSVYNLVILPDKSLTTNETFPVVYLLHGAFGKFSNWYLEVPELENYADQYDIIIVCPDGGYTSWYFDSPIDTTMQYETYIAKELIHAVDKKYSTVPNEKGRAITGLSMGGHGAFYLAFKHPDIWGAAGSMSGGLDFRPFPEKWDIAKRLGNYADNKEVWEENTVINMVNLLEGKKLKLIFDCGVDDFFYEVNNNMHEELLAKNIAHDYTERPGIHNWDYWINSVKYQLLFFNEYFVSVTKN